MHGRVAIPFNRPVAGPGGANAARSQQRQRQQPLLDFQYVQGAKMDALARLHAETTVVPRGAVGQRAKNAFSARQLSELHDLFQGVSSADDGHAPGQQADKGDGVTRDQLWHALSQAGIDSKEFVNSVFAAWDVDGDGLINWREFLAAMTILSAGNSEASDENEERLRAESIFRVFDINQDGSVDRGELQTVLRLAATVKADSGSTPPSDAEIREHADELFRLMDTNGDGVLSQDEFVAGARAHGLFDIGPQLTGALSRAGSQLHKERALAKLVEGEFGGKFDDFWCFLTEYIHSHAIYSENPNSALQQLSEELASLPSQRAMLLSSGMAPGASADAQRAAIRMSTVGRNLTSLGSHQSQSASTAAGDNVSVSIPTKHAQLSLVQSLHPNFSAQSLAEFRRRFQQLDTASTGFVSRAQFSRAFADAGIDDKTFIEHLFSLWDKNGDDQLDVNEFLLAMCALADQSVPQAEKLRFLFDVLDIDASGAISKDELARGMFVAAEARGTETNAVDLLQRVDAMFAAADTNNDNLISFEEFSQFAESSELFAEIPEIGLMIATAKRKAQRGQGGLALSEFSRDLLGEKAKDVHTISPSKSRSRVLQILARFRLTPSARLVLSALSGAVIGAVAISRTR